MRPILYLAGAGLLSIIGTSWIASAAGDSAGEFIALTRAALDRWGKGDIQGLLDLYAPDVTYFDPVQKSLIPYEYANWPEAFAAFMAADWELIGADVAPGAWTFSFRKAIPGPPTVLPSLPYPPINP